MSTAKTKEELEALLLSNTPGDHSPLTITFARQFVEAVAEPQLGESEGLGTFGAMIGSFAIRNDDVAIFDWLAAALMSTASVGFFVDSQASDSAVGKALIGVACAIGKAVHDFGTKGVWLHPEYAAILLVLKRTSDEVAGLTSEEILASARGICPNLDQESLELALERLMHVPVRVGTRAFVHRDADARWRSLV